MVLWSLLNDQEMDIGSSGQKTMTAMRNANDAPGTQGLGTQPTAESCGVQKGAQVSRRHLKKKAQRAGGDAPPSQAL